MSEIPKLNLKALKHIASEEKITPSETTVEVDSSLLNEQKVNKKEATVSKVTTVVPEIHNAPAKMSFASIRKTVDDTNTEEKVVEETSPRAPKVESMSEIKTEDTTPDIKKVVSVPEKKVDEIISPSKKSIIPTVEIPLEKTSEEKPNTNLSIKEDSIKDVSTNQAAIKQEEKVEQTPEEIEAILTSAENTLVEKKKKRGLF
jgi:hypothetical protein